MILVIPIQIYRQIKVLFQKIKIFIRPILLPISYQLNLLQIILKDKIIQLLILYLEIDQLIRKVIF